MTPRNPGLKIKTIIIIKLAENQRPHNTGNIQSTELVKESCQMNDNKKITTTQHMCAHTHTHTNQKINLEGARV